MATIRQGVLAALAVAALGLGGCSGGRGGSDGGMTAPQYGYEGRPGVGGEVRAADDPQSTFAVDVDTASYGYARRLITDGRRPEPGNVRPEEFVNAFNQEYAQPRGDGFAVHADGARTPAGHRDDGQLLLRVGLQTRAEDRSERRDAALTFVVDVSGSMAEPGRLDLVQDALHTLIEQMRPADSVAIVAYSSDARVIRKMTPVSRKADLHKAVDELRIEASTNLEAGLVLGYRVARDGFRSGATNRVILLSDGLANVGNTNAQPILRQIEEEANKQIALLGIGVGSDYGDKLMEQLADKGDGFVVYVSERAHARRVFVEQLPATLAVRALDAKVQVTFDAHAVQSYRLIGYENRAVADRDFRNDRVDGGEVGPGHSVTALYVLRLTREARPDDQVARVQVRWLDPKSRAASEAAAAVRVSDVDGAFTGAAARLQVCYAAAYLAEVLRGGPGASAVRLADLARVADAAADRTEDPAVRELADLIERASGLAD